MTHTPTAHTHTDGTPCPFAVWYENFFSNNPLTNILNGAIISVTFEKVAVYRPPFYTEKIQGGEGKKL